MAKKMKKTKTLTIDTRIRQRKGVRKDQDFTLSWFKSDYPEYSEWHNLAVAWLEEQNTGRWMKLKSVVLFLERFLVQYNLATRLADFMAHNDDRPGFFETVCPKSREGVLINNNIHRFLDFVLSSEFCRRDGDGQPIVSPMSGKPLLLTGFFNPVHGQGRLYKTQESRIKPRKVKLLRSKTANLIWINQRYPQLSEWSPLAEKWMEGQNHIPPAKPGV
ncbi:MAG: hypothetical protein HQM09_23300 [Candidatus Riflebacteria bacterium]|nr:hypothetical protein [Candidatus Riflebacteria bacterium]